MIEERILDSLSWEPGSPLYSLIIHAAVPQSEGAGATLGVASVASSSAVIRSSSGSPSPSGGPPHTNTHSHHHHHYHTAARLSPSPNPPDMMQGVIAATVCDALSQREDHMAAGGSSPSEVEDPTGSHHPPAVSGIPGASERQPGHVHHIPSPKRTHGDASASSSSQSLCHGLASPSPLKKCRLLLAFFFPLQVGPEYCASVLLARYLTPNLPFFAARCESEGILSAAVPRLLFQEPLPLAIGKPPASTSVTILDSFLAKVLKLMSFRLALLVDSFDFSPLDRHTVYDNVRDVLEHALHNQTHLLYNRHADQVVLSALYGYCKVHKLDKVRMASGNGSKAKAAASCPRHGISQLSLLCSYIMCGGLASGTTGVLP